MIREAASEDADRSNRGKVIFYKPSFLEEVLAMIIIMFGGLAFVSAASESGSFSGIMDIVTKLFMAGILGYIMIIFLRETIIRPLYETIAKIKINQIKIIIKEACNKEIDDTEAISILNKLYKTKKKKNGRTD